MRSVDLFQLKFLDLTFPMSDYETINETEQKTFKSYKRRWFYLFIVCLAQISNAFVCFSNMIEHNHRWFLSY